MELQAEPQTRQKAIKAAEQHIIDVGKGRVRLDMTPQELDEYIADEIRRLRVLQAKGLRT